MPGADTAGNRPHVAPAAARRTPAAPSRVRWPDAALGLLIALSFVALFAAVVRQAFCAAGDERLMPVLPFGGDERYIIRQVETNLAEGSLDPHGYYDYGYGYHGLGILLLRGLARLGRPVGFRTIALCLRFVSLSALLAAGTAFCCLMRRQGLTWTMAALAALALVSVEAVAFFGRTIHPDALQLALVIAAMCLASARHNAASALLAASVAGLAFGVKYAGAFLLPFTVLPYALRRLPVSSRESRPVARTILEVGSVAFAAALLFALVSLAVNPYAVRDFPEFWRDFNRERLLAARGHYRPEPTNPFLWFGVVGAELGGAGIVLTLAGGTTALLGCMRRALRSGGPRAFFDEASDRTLVALFAFLGLSGLYVFFGVNRRLFHYLLFALPAALAVAFLGLDAIRRRLRGPWPAALGFAVFACVAVSLWRTIGHIDSIPRSCETEAVRVGQWLDAHVEPQARILYDYYTFVPATFEVVRATYTFQTSDLDAFDPDVIVLLKKRSSWYVWKRAGTSFAQHHWVPGNHDCAPAVRAAFEYIFAPDSPWEVLRETEESAVLIRKDRAQRLRSPGKLSGR